MSANHDFQNHARNLKMRELPRTLQNYRPNPHPRLTWNATSEGLVRARQQTIACKSTLSGQIVGQLILMQIPALRSFALIESCRQIVISQTMWIHPKASVRILRSDLLVSKSEFLDIFLMAYLVESIMVVKKMHASVPENHEFVLLSIHIPSVLITRSAMFLRVHPHCLQMNWF